MPYELRRHEWDLTEDEQDRARALVGAVGHDQAHWGQILPYEVAAWDLFRFLLFRDISMRLATADLGFADLNAIREALNPAVRPTSIRNATRMLLSGEGKLFEAHTLGFSPDCTKLVACQVERVEKVE